MKRKRKKKKEKDKIKIKKKQGISRAEPPEGQLHCFHEQRKSPECPSSQTRVSPSGHQTVPCSAFPPFQTFPVVSLFWLGFSHQVTQLVLVVVELALFCSLSFLWSENREKEVSE
jgi:hypothetical protein